MGNPELGGEPFIFLLVCLGNQRTDDEQKRVGFFPNGNGKSAQQVVNALKRIQYAGVHHDRAVSKLVLSAKSLGIGIIEEIGFDAGGDHVDLSGRDAVLDEPIPQLCRNGRDVVGENWREPIQAARQTVGEKRGPDEFVSCQFVAHEIDRVVEQRASRQPLRHNPDERAFVVVRMNDIDPLLADNTTEKAK